MMLDFIANKICELFGTTSKEKVGVEFSLDKRANIREAFAGEIDFNISKDVLGEMLNIAVRQGNVKLSQLLIGKGADVNQDDSLIRPLNTAIYSGNIDIVSMLLDNGADINYGDLGYTSLYSAISSNRPDIVKLLLDRGADTSINYLGQEEIYGQYPEGISITEFAKVEENFEILALLEQKLASDLSGECPAMLYGDMLFYSIDN